LRCPPRPERAERRREKRREQSGREEEELRAAGAEFALLLVRLRAQHGRAVRQIRTLHRLYLDYPTEALRKAIAHALAYGLTDLVRLEKLLLRQIAGDYFRLKPPAEDDEKN
jgi:hypothetical protein